MDLSFEKKKKKKKTLVFVDALEVNTFPVSLKSSPFVFSHLNDYEDAFMILQFTYSVWHLFLLTANHSLDEKLISESFSQTKLKTVLQFIASVKNISDLDSLITLCCTACLR